MFSLFGHKRPPTKFLVSWQYLTLHITMPMSFTMQCIQILNLGKREHRFRYSVDSVDSITIGMGREKVELVHP